MKVSHAYRNEIDGMRALAVLSVIFYHCGFEWFPGGYVGVDVFFVLSGYLITSIILVDQSNDRYSLWTFYERRARRILPALFFVLLSIIPFAVYLMSDDQLESFAKGLSSISFGLSNIFFWMSEDYFNSETEFNPLVHTWSLAIEEQFYFLFSLLFLFFSITVDHHGRFLCRFLLLVSLLSLFVAQWSGNLLLTPPFFTSTFFWFSQQSWSSFYLLPGRIWELTFGALLAIHHHYRRCREESDQPVASSSLIKQFGSLLGLVLVLSSILTFNRATPFPSFWTLIPTVGTVLLLEFADQSTWIGQCLSLKWIRWIGLSSYSSYLCHQPLLAFVKMTSMGETLPLHQRWLIVLLSLMLGVISWNWIESPWRDRQRFSRKQIFRYALIGIVLLNLIAAFLLLQPRSNLLQWKVKSPKITEGLLRRNSSNTTEEVINNDYLEETKWKRASSYVGKRFDSLVLFKSFDSSAKMKKKKRLLLIGDSHAKDFLNIIVENKKFLDYQIRFHYVSGRCQIYLAPEDRNQFIEASYLAYCSKDNDVRDGFPLIRQADLIILIAFWKDWAAERLNYTIEQMNLTKDQQILVVGTKSFSKTSPQAYINQPRSYRVALRSEVQRSFRQKNDILIKNLNPAIFVDILKIVCGMNYSCPIFSPQERLISFDGSHLTKSGTLFVGRLLFQSPLLSRF